MKFSFLLIGILAFIQWPSGSYASVLPTVDSLLMKWNLEKDTAVYERKLSLLLDLAQEYRYSLPVSALVYANRAIDMMPANSNRYESYGIRIFKGWVWLNKKDYRKAKEILKAHDIKSPMSIMISFTELLHDDFESVSISDSGVGIPPED